MQILMEHSIFTNQMLSIKGIYEVEKYLGLATEPLLFMIAYRQEIMLHQLN